MLSVPSYQQAWDRKWKWYAKNGYLDRVVTSEDGADGSIDVTAIEQSGQRILARPRITAGLLAPSSKNAYPAPSALTAACCGSA